jgi:hypothetical protein
MISKEAEIFERKIAMLTKKIKNLEDSVKIIQASNSYFELSTVLSKVDRTKHRLDAWVAAYAAYNYSQKEQENI